MRVVEVTPDAPDFDAAMREAYREETCVHLAEGHYKTAGVNPWTRRAGRGFIIDGQLIMEGDVTIEIDGALIPDADVTGEPLIALKGRGVWDKFGVGLAPSDVWDKLPEQQTVFGGTVICNHSTLVDRWRGLGFPLKTAAVQLHGHGQLIKGVTAEDTGAFRFNSSEGAESFPFFLSGVDGALDSTPLVQLEPATHIFSDKTRAPEISDCTWEGYVPEASNDQVTVNTIMGVFGEANGWNRGDWRYLWVRDWLMSDNTVRASGKNLVQGFTAYLGRSGRCVNNLTDGADIGVYGDYLQSENSTVELNQFLKCRNGVALYLSPTPRPLSDNFYQSGHKIGLNKINSTGKNVVLDTLNREWEKLLAPGDVRADRIIRDIGIHSSLSVEALDGASYYEIDPAIAKRRGCL